MQYPRQPPLLYYDISQKSPLFLIGAVVGESPHGLEGSCIYLSLIYSKYDIHASPSLPVPEFLVIFVT
jgi:hypothetical protein